MESSFVGIGEHGFWMRDERLALFLRFAALNIAEDDARDPALRALRDTWLLQSAYAFTGCMDTGLRAEATRPAARRAVECLRGALEASNAPVDPAALGLMGIDAWGPPPRSQPRSDLIETCDAMLRLLDGETTTTAADAVYVPTPRRMEGP